MVKLHIGRGYRFRFTDGIGQWDCTGTVGWLTPEKVLFVEIDTPRRRMTIKREQIKEVFPL